MVRQNVAIVNFYVSFFLEHSGKVSTSSKQQVKISSEYYWLLQVHLLLELLISSQKSGSPNKARL